jgi:flavin-dependent dehydrogenase
MKRFAALVIGGGPAGSTAALMLARAGWSVGVVEKTAFPRRKVCGEYVSGTTWPVLRALGVADALASHAGPPVRRVGFFSGESVVDAPMPRGGGEWGRALGRDLLDAALLERAREAGAEILQPWAAHELHAGDEGFSAVIEEAGTAHRAEVHARIVIDAHGSWERGVAPTATREAPRDSDLLGFKARFVGAALAAGLMPLVLFPGGYGGLVHSDAGRVSFSCCIRRDALARCRREHPGLAAGEAVLTHAMESCRGVREALAGAARDGPWLAAGPIRPGIRAHFERGVFAVGNAAGEAHPLVAEGISMAIQSSWLLCEGLAALRDLSPQAIEAQGRGYAARWRRHLAPRVRAAALFAAFTGHPAGAAASAQLLKRVPALLTLGAHWSGKAHTLGIGLPHGATR